MWKNTENTKLWEQLFDQNFRLEDVSRRCLPNAIKHSSHPSHKIIPGWWLTYPSEKWWSKSQLGWWHSQVNGKSENSCSKPPTRHTTPSQLEWFTRLLGLRPLFGRPKMRFSKGDLAGPSKLDPASQLACNAMHVCGCIWHITIIHSLSWNKAICGGCTSQWGYYDWSAYTCILCVYIYIILIPQVEICGFWDDPLC